MLLREVLRKTLWQCAARVLSLECQEGEDGDDNWRSEVARERLAVETADSNYVSGHDNSATLSLDFDDFDLDLYQASTFSEDGVAMPMLLLSDIASSSHIAPRRYADG